MLESGINNSENPRRQEKLASEGSDWVKRVKKEQQTFSEEDERKMNIFCAKPIEDLLKMEKLTQNEQFKREIDENPEHRKKIKEYNDLVWGSAKDKLKLAAQVAEEDLKKIFLEFLKTKDIEEVAQNLSIDYSTEENQDSTNEAVNKKIEQSQKTKTKTLSQQDIKKTVITEDIANILTKQCAEGDIDEVYLSIIRPALERYQHDMFKQEEELRKEIPKLVKKFETLLEDAMKKGVFPVDPSIVKERIAQLKIILMDPLTAQLAKETGEFRSTDHTIVISLDVIKNKKPVSLAHKFFHFISNTATHDEKQALETLGHEIFHGISGQSGNPEVTRVGIRFRKDKSRRSIDKIPPSFEWLNEALTEQATMDLLGKKQGDVYSAERELLKMMIQNGISRDSLYKAYFDNYTVKKTDKHRTIELKNLFDETNKKFGKTFLVNLDRYIAIINLEADDKKMGIYQAIEAWKMEKENFPQYLEEWHKEQREAQK